MITTAFCMSLQNWTRDSMRWQQKEFAPTLCGVTWAYRSFASQTCGCVPAPKCCRPTATGGSSTTTLSGRHWQWRLGRSICFTCCVLSWDGCGQERRHYLGFCSCSWCYAPHFWERRSAKGVPASDRRRGVSQTVNSVRVAVSDTGPGIAAEHHQEIFEDFVRVDRSSSGMGLGLAIAHRLVQAHRGKIWVDSELNRGSTFTVLLPTDTV